MKVLSVVNSLNRGGIEVQLLQALPWLKDHGIKMDVCRTAPGLLDEDYKRLGCKLWTIPKSPNCLATAKHFQAVLREEDYDCVHCHLEHASGGYALGAARAGVALAVSLHNAIPVSLYGWRRKPFLAQARSAWLRWHRYLINKHARVIAGHSQVNIENYAPDWRKSGGRHRVIMNGVDFPATVPSRAESRAALGCSEREVTLLHVGSFKKEKNHPGLLEIFKHVLKHEPNAKLIMVGDGPYPYSRPAAEEHARKLGLLGHLRFEGVRSDVSAYYAAADVFIFPSEMEGFGNVLVESQAAGLPVVASDIAAHRESVAPHQHDFLFSIPQYDRAADLVLKQVACAAWQ